MLPSPGLPAIDPAALRRVLIIKTSSIGDVVHGLPVASALRRRYPDLRISWVVESWIADLLAGHGAIDRVVRWPRMRWPGSAAAVARWLGELRSATRELRSEPYDLAIDLQGLAKSTWIALRSGARSRIGLEGQREGAHLFTAPVACRATGRHAVDECLRAAEHLGAPAHPVRFDLPVDAAAAERVEPRLREARASQRLIVVNPSASARRKTATDRLWRSVIENLGADGTVVIVGSADQRAAHHAIIRGLGCLDWTGETTLGELVALLSKAALHVAPDTGSLHIAAAQGRPVVGLYGPTPPERLGPHGQLEHVVARRDLCAPACALRCRHESRCMSAIEPADVIRAARRALA